MTPSMWFMVQWWSVPYVLAWTGWGFAVLGYGLWRVLWELEQQPEVDKQDRSFGYTCAWCREWTALSPNGRGWCWRCQMDQRNLPVRRWLARCAFGPVTEKSNRRRAV